MASRTYIPGLKIAVEVLRKYCKKWTAEISKNGGPPIAALVDLLLSIADVLISVLEASSDASGNYGDPISDIDTAHINQIAAAFASWNAKKEGFD